MHTLHADTIHHQ
jgi:hypothetical protein